MRALNAVHDAVDAVDTSTRDLHGNHSVEQERPSGTTESAVRQPDHIQLPESGHDLEREGTPLPVLIDGGLDPRTS
jgi:hypothetical protein